MAPVDPDCAEAPEVVAEDVFGAILPEVELAEADAAADEREIVAEETAEDLGAVEAADAPEWIEEADAPALATDPVEEALVEEPMPRRS